MQIIMESLIGWDFTLGKQTKLGIFGEVLGFGDTTEEQAKKLFILIFFHLLLVLTDSLACYGQAQKI